MRGKISLSQHHFSIVGQGEEGWDARCWRLHGSEPSESGWRRPRGRGCFMRSTASVSDALGLAIAVERGKWDIGRDWRTGSMFARCLLAGGVI